jgi:hypothetical protein
MIRRAGGGDSAGTIRARYYNPSPVKRPSSRSFSAWPLREIVCRGTPRRESGDDWFRLSAQGRVAARVVHPPDALLCRLSAPPGDEVVQLAIGRPRSALANALYSPAQDLGLQFFQVDDGWQGNGYGHGGNRDWFKPCRARFPRGMKALADDIRRHGLRPGLWLIPFTQSDPRPVPLRRRRRAGSAYPGAVPARRARRLQSPRTGGVEREEVG